MGVHALPYFQSLHATLVASAIDPPINGGVVVLEPTFAHLSFAGDGQSERGKVKL